MMHFNFHCELPTLSEAERNALSMALQKTIQKFLFYEVGKPFTDDDLSLLREMHISA